jgi:hypothetical protein
VREREQTHRGHKHAGLQGQWAQQIASVEKCRPVNRQGGWETEAGVCAGNSNAGSGALGASSWGSPPSQWGAALGGHQRYLGTDEFRGSSSVWGSRPWMRLSSECTGRRRTWRRLGSHARAGPRVVVGLCSPPPGCLARSGWRGKACHPER